MSDQPKPLRVTTECHKCGGGTGQISACVCGVAPADGLITSKATPPAERPTLETDAMSKGFDYRGLPCLEMAVGLCRRLERELAEAKKSAVCIHEGTAASAHGWALMFSEVRKELEANELVLQKLQNERDEAIQARNHNRVCIERLTVERDRLAAFVGTIRQWFDIPLRNVNDITLAEHSREIGSAVEDLKQQRDQLAAQFTKLDKPKYSGAPMMDKVLSTRNPEFDAWVQTLPPTYWTRYDLSAARIGWEAAKGGLA